MEIVFKSVSKKFDNAYALSDISCCFNSGNLIGIVGTNGAGKSTLMKILATILKPDAGDILLNNTSIVKHPEKMRKVIGYLPQDVALYPNLSVTEFLCYMASIKGINRWEGKKQIKNLLNILHLNNTEEKRLGDFSGGMKQRVGIACALLGNPQVLIVDEPTVGLDPQERILIRNILAEQTRDRIVILSTHIISDIEAVSSKILVMKSGKMIFSGSQQELVKTAKGYVWEFFAPKDYNIGMQSGISSIIQTDKGIKVRQVARSKPNENANIVTPTLEDSCIYILGGK